MQWLKIIQIVVAILLMASILVQNRGGGVSGIFGGESIYRTKRGIEKSLFYATIVLAVLFFAVAIIGIVLQKA